MVFPVYFNVSLPDIEKVERNLINTKSFLSPSSLSVKRDEAIEWMNSNGEVTWVSPTTGTMALWKPSLTFLSTIPDLKMIAGMPCTFNNYYTFPHSITVSYFNLVGDGDFKSFEEWNTSLDLYPSNSAPIIGNPVNTATIGDGNNAIVLIERGPISEDSLVVFTNYYNAKYSTSYSPSHFINKIQFEKINVDGTTSIIPLTSGTYQDDISSNFTTEAIIDIFTVFEMNPEMNIKCCTGLSAPTSGCDTNIIVQSLSGRNTISASILTILKMDSRDRERISFETRINSMMGTTIFSATGDTGPYPVFANGVDFNKPDSYGFNADGDGIITVGGFVQYEEKLYPMNVLNVDGTSVIPLPGAASGGFRRGYRNPEWKRKAASSYGKVQSITEFRKSDGSTLSVSQNIDYSGAIYPDVIENASMTLPLLSKRYFGTSIAAPTVATRFVNAFPDGIPSFYRMLYLPEFEGVLTRPVKGRNTFGAGMGYCSDSSSQWDPVNGRGVIDFEKLKEMI